MMTSIYDFKVQDEHGHLVSLDRYRGKVLLIVNTATKCGLAPQFEQLEALYQDYQQAGFVILGFPSDQFKQELDSATAAAEACRVTYGVSFPMHDLIKVNGPQTAPLFAYLKQAAPGVMESTTIKWNFTKFLVDRQGHVIQRFAPRTTPKACEPEIQAVLKKLA